MLWYTQVALLTSSSGRFDTMKMLWYTQVALLTSSSGRFDTMKMLWYTQVALLTSFSGRFDTMKMLWYTQVALLTSSRHHYIIHWLHYCEFATLHKNNKIAKWSTLLPSLTPFSWLTGSPKFQNENITCTNSFHNMRCSCFTIKTQVTSRTDLRIILFLTERISPSWKTTCSITLCRWDSEFGNFTFTHCHASFIPTWTRK